MDSSCDRGYFPTVSYTHLDVYKRQPRYTEINVIDNYAPTAKADVTIVDADGKPVADAKVEFKVYNYCLLCTSITGIT